jgi:hypothetical protein
MFIVKPHLVFILILKNQNESNNLKGLSFPLFDDVEMKRKKIPRCQQANRHIKHNIDDFTNLVN